jgi:transposase
VIRIEFTENEVEQLRDISFNHPHQFARCKALSLLLKSQGIAHHVIAKIVNVCGNTLCGYFRAYLQDRIDSITTVNFKRPESSLKPFKDVVIEYLKETPPTSTKQACSEIEKLTGIALKETQMRKYLKSLGVRFRKVAGIPAKADVAKQKEFLETELQPRLKEAETGKRKVYFVDAAHFVLGTFLGYVWSFTRIFVKTPSGRQRFNVLGALDAVTKEFLSITNTTYITSVQVCELFHVIAQKAIDPVKNTMCPVTIVCDNAKYQRCKLVMETAQSLNIELLFLPSYSPNLNLIERVWKFTKKRCLNSKYYPTFDLFRGAISSFLNTMHSTYATELKTLLTLKFQTFKQDQLVT